MTCEVQSESHYENLAMQYTRNVLAEKKGKFQQIFVFIFFLIFVLNIDCGYSNVYPQSMFRVKIRKIGIPLHAQVLLYK